MGLIEYKPGSNGNNGQGKARRGTMVRRRSIEEIKKVVSKDDLYQHVNEEFERIAGRLRPRLYMN